MRPTYRANFTIGSAAPVTLDNVADDLHRWLARRSPRITREMLTQPGTAETDGFRIETAVARDGQLYAMRFTQPDERDPAFLWQTEAAIELQDGTADLNVEVANGWSDRRVAPHRTTASRPTIIPTLIDRYGAHLQRNPILTRGVMLDERTLKLLPAITFAPERILPIVYISRINAGNRLPIDPDLLANQLAGIAHVIASTDRDHAGRLKAEMGPQMSAYNGAVRLYWPMHNSPEMRNPRQHPYWHNVVDDDPREFAHMLLRQISEYAVSRMPTLTFGDVKRAALLEKNADDPVALALAESYAQEAETLREQIHELQNRILVHEATITQRDEALQELRGQITRAASALEPPRPVRTTVDAIERFREARGDQPVLLMGRAIRSAKGCQFTQPERILSALEWLADVYQPSKAGLANADLAVSAHDALGMLYSAHQAESTMGQYREEYFIERDKQVFALEGHLGVGRGHDPRKTLRIAFAFDPRDNRVLVGYIGYHQTNRKT